MTAPQVRLPVEPYPGLRPFLDFEAALLFGRERQVREVIERLAATQFVAVLGGSGSGKSSLIHAGVVPELRSFGIPGAGDLWLPMTCTPGTNVGAADIASRRHSPVTRLARRFAALLRSSGSDADDRRRIDAIADVFRQEAGFSRLLETFGKDLAVPVGPDPADARVLFVIDQFEEIFHPTNQGVDDARLLVERVLDHFFNPHPRCHVVLTMRSEHLNDCAAYLELPDAINKSSYLIRRLDPDELRSAIVGPAQRFLRMMARAARTPGERDALPAQVVFDDGVLDRLLRDVQAITHDPDHLPLLQHLLARLWQAALLREGAGRSVPAFVTADDLLRAVRAGQGGDGGPIDARTNTLRACVENWPESIYRRLDDKERGQAARGPLECVLSRLAFKDPNTGLYSQQRIAVDDAARLLGPGSTRDDLRRLLDDGLLGSVDYLYWDDDEPDRVTLKVSHESFIRGWSRLRHLIDEDSARFDEFVAVLRKTADWSDSGRSDDFLIETGEKRRLADSGFVERLRQEGQFETWLRFVPLDRDGARLARVAPEIDDFLAASEARLLDRARRERRMRSYIRVLVATTVVFGLLPTALVSALVQGPTLLRAEKAFEAGHAANRVRLDERQQRIGAASDTLARLLRAADRLDEARRGAGSLRIEASAAFLDWRGASRLFPLQREFLRNVFAQSEPPINSTLRDVLTSSVWHAAAPDRSTTGSGVPQPLPMPEVVADAECKVSVSSDSATPLRRGTLYVERRDGAADGRALRAIFHPPRESRDGRLEVYSAVVSPADRSCRLGRTLVAMPAAVDARLVFDAGMRYVYTAAEHVDAEPLSLIVQEFDWDSAGGDRVQVLQTDQLATIGDPAAIAAVRAAAGPTGVAVVPTWSVPGGRQVEVGDRRWRIVSRQAQRLPELPPADEVAGLAPLAGDSTCAGLVGSLEAPYGFRIDSRESGRHCFRIATGWPHVDGTLRPARDEVRVAVHERPTNTAQVQPGELPPEPIAGLVPFVRLASNDGAAPRADWFVGTAGPHEGWLLMSTADAGGQHRVFGLPWSTAALARLGCELQRANPPSDQRLAAACSGR